MNLLLNLLIDNEDDGKPSVPANPEAPSHEKNTNNFSIPQGPTWGPRKIVLVIIAGIIALAALVALVLGIKWHLDRAAERRIAEEAEREAAEAYANVLNAGNNYIEARNKYGANPEEAEKLNGNQKKERAKQLTRESIKASYNAVSTGENYTEARIKYGALSEEAKKSEGIYRNALVESRDKDKCDSTGTNRYRYGKPD